MNAAPSPAPSPLPPGTFRIDRDGAWRHEGQEVTHPGVLRNLYANLRVDGQGHYLQVGPARIPVEVEDAPFLVIRVEVPSWDNPGSRLGRYRHETVFDLAGLRPDRVVAVDPHGVRGVGPDESLDPAGIWLGAHGAPYCRVTGGRFVARFSVAAWLQLAEAVEEEAGGGGPVLVLGGRRIPLPRRP